MAPRLDTPPITPIMKNEKLHGKWMGLERSLDETVKKHRNEKIPTPFPSRILGPTTSWKTFFRQKDAFDFSRSKAKDLHVFAFESDTYETNTGQRMYLVASYPVFWHYYSQLTEERRHHYEVIPEGAVCKLYFDLEFNTTLNPTSNGNRMVELLIQFVCLALELEFGVKCTGEDVLDLDASTTEKFSRHLIFQMKKVVFKDNIHAGNFVNYILSQLMSYRQDKVTDNDARKPETTRNNKEGNLTENMPAHEIKKSHKIADESGLRNTQDHIDKHGSGLLEYKTDNINTESLDSGQHKTENQLELLQGEIHKNTITSDGSKSLENESKEVDRTCENTVQCDSKVNTCTIGTSTIDDSNNASVDVRYRKLLQHFTLEEMDSFLVKNKNEDTVLFCDLGVYTKNRNFRLYLSSKLNKKNPLVVSSENKCGMTDTQEIFMHSLISNVKFSTSTKVLSFEKESDSLVSYTNKRSERVDAKDSIDGYNKSPYPEVDEYITSLITQNEIRGSIRHWTYFNQGEILLYEISRYRFCHNIGRQHRSNNIMFIVDLHRGIFYQKCHDPDCHAQNYKSPEWPLPHAILPDSYFMDIKDDFDMEMDDQELLDSTLELEKSIQNKSTDMTELNDSDDDALVQAADLMDTNDARNPI